MAATMDFTVTVANEITTSRMNLPMSFNGGVQMAYMGWQFAC
jgi:hypothetical protein